jgi:hypothetical protein
MPDPLTIYEVRYDADDTYFVAARFASQEAARALRDRLAEAHHAADRDGCHLDSAWLVETLTIIVDEAHVTLPADLFDIDRDGHAEVNIDRLPIETAQPSAGDGPSVEDAVEREVARLADGVLRERDDLIRRGWLMDPDLPNDAEVRAWVAASITPADPADA